MLPASMRIELFYKPELADGRSPRIAGMLKAASSEDVARVAIIDVFIVEGVEKLSSALVKDVFADSVAQDVLTDAHAADLEIFSGWSALIEISYKAGVTDPVAITAGDAVSLCLGGKFPEGAFIQTARQYLIYGASVSPSAVGRMTGALHNPLIERSFTLSCDEWRQGKRPPSRYPHSVAPSPVAVEKIPVSGLDEAALNALSKNRLLALTVPEMMAVQSYFSDPEVREARVKAGMPPEPTDVELEMIAQTWSEHCKHKIFQARIEYTENGTKRTIASLFREYIKRTTELLSGKKDFLRSVFHDNAGVVQFDSDTLLCFKVETHNSPSALDPYGGAITGIVGVNRDILGTGKGAKPIFNTDVLCFGMPDTPPEAIPEGLLHPKRVMAGVHRGIVDGGNQSGIPVAAGAFLFDESYTGKPLVFCGTGGILPASIAGESAWVKHTNPGDLAVMVGGRIGKDGIHGATFSSLVLDETSPTSAVQIGDPITQKKMIDFLLEARDQSLYDGITDNGAGGLSSSLGEMAQASGGIRIDLEKCPLKYQGLAPWEILVSESQERMSVSVPPRDVKPFLELASRRDVEATVIGEFTDSGFIDIRYDGKPVGLLSMEFLHGGLPEMRLSAEWKAPVVRERVFSTGNDATGVLLRLLSEPNIASKEPLVRQYDHEVQAQSVIKPFMGRNADGPSDGAVLRPKPDSFRGITVTHGICPRYGDTDTYHMAWCAVDEAFRAHVACGGDPDCASALDNFCWPDPVLSAETPDGEYKLAQLVRACMGLQDACLAYGLPLISGKDSMKNDARIGGKKVSVRPTLLVSLLGIVPDVRKSVSTDFKREGDAVYLLGETRRELAGTSFEKITGSRYAEVPTVHAETALGMYRALSRAIGEKLVESCHDLSDGGLAVALAESAIAGRLGADISLDDLPVSGSGVLEPEALLFSETPSRFIVTVREEARTDFEKVLKGTFFKRVGRVTGDGKLAIGMNGRLFVECALEKLVSAWKREGQTW